MSPDETRAVQAARAINKFREEKSTASFDIAEIQGALKANGCPYSTAVVTILRKKLIITQAEKRGRYMFPIAEPVAYKTILHDLAEYAKTFQNYNHTNKVKHGKDGGTTQKYTQENLDFMIEVLKANGYKIQKPVINYEDV